jgi:hypothetical protein
MAAPGGGLFGPKSRVPDTLGTPQGATSQSRHPHGGLIDRELWGAGPQPGEVEASKIRLSHKRWMARIGCCPNACPGRATA